MLRHGVLGQCVMVGMASRQRRIRLPRRGVRGMVPGGPGRWLARLRQSRRGLYRNGRGWVGDRMAQAGWLAGYARLARGSWLDRPTGLCHA